ncbi:MAG: phosphatase PAP2 family protein [Clostridiales bacterium]|nr:phosphatase PAP2 family protein [Clostridiales bacterium]
MLDAIQSLDSALLLFLQTHLRSAFLDSFMTVYTTLGDNGLVWIAVSLVFLCFRPTRRAGLLALCAMLLGLICNNMILKHLFSRPRPYLTVPGLLPLIPPPDPNSFPSGHTCAAFAAASIWWRALPQRLMGAVGLAAALLMGFSRLYVGVHFLTDVLTGMAVGLLCAFLVWHLSLRWTAKRL